MLRSPAALMWALFVICLVLNVSGLNRVVLLDIDEPRFAEASRNMLRGGDLIVPWFNGAVRFDKPVLIYWVQAPFMLAADHGVVGWELAARLPSALAVAIASVLVASIGRLLGLRSVHAALAGLMLNTCVQAQIMGHAATADALLLLLATCVAHGQLRRFVHGPSAASFVQVWLGASACFLTKGPPGLVAPAALAVGVMLVKGRPSWRAVAGGLVLFLVPILLWAIPAILRTNGDFLYVGLGKHVLERSLRPFEGHGGFAPWWYLFYFGSIPLTFLPWSFWLPGALRVLLGRVTAPIPGTARLLATWLGGTVLVFTIATSKLPHYPLPAFPALCLATVLWLQAADEGISQTWWRGIAVGMAVFAVGVVIGLPATFIVFDMHNAVLPAASVALTLAVGLLVAARCMWQRQHRAGMLATGSAAVLAFSLLTSMLLPRFNEHQLARVAGRDLPPHVRNNDKLHIYGLVMPSLTFYLGRTVERIRGTKEVPEVDRGLEVIATQGSLLLVRDKRLAELRQVAVSRGRLDLVRALDAPLSRVCGFMPSKGRWIGLSLVGRRAP